MSFVFLVIRHTENRRVDGILTASMNIDFTEYDPYLRFLKCEASDALYIQDMGIHVSLDAFGKSRSSVQKNLVAHFYSVEE